VTPPPAPPPALKKATDFYPHLDGRAHVGTGAFGQWTSRPVGNTIHVQWGESVEHWSVRVCDGEDWVWVYGYSPAATAALAPAYPIETVKATITSGGVTRDITHLCNPDAKPNGGVFMPLEVPASGTTVIRQWFWVWNAMGVRDRIGYWEATYTYGGRSLNSCWTGPPPMTRTVIAMQEAWWDASGGAIDRAKFLTPPWVNGVPVVPSVEYLWRTEIAEGAGVLWDACLYKVE
jgi:hypothetical protein